jgi:hypothetical protein
MVLNIGKYQLPYLEYNLFKDYIAENLCARKNETGNSCQGKCHLEKQIKSVAETDENSSGNPAAKIQIKGMDDYVIRELLLSAPNRFIETQLLSLADTHLPKTALDIPVPPPRRFV